MKKILLIMGVLSTGLTYGQEPVVVPATPTTKTTTTTTTEQQQQPVQPQQKSDTIVVQLEPVRRDTVVKQDTVYMAERPHAPNDDSPTLDRVYIGGRVLATVTDVDINQSESGTVTTEIVWGYGVGGYIGYNFSPHFALQLEVLYQSLAQRIKYNNVDQKLNLRYLNLPLLFVFNTDIRKPVNFNVCVGPQLGFRLGADLSTEDGAGSSPDTLQAALSVKPSDIGFAYGAGFDFKLSPALKLGIGFRGVVGLIDIDENSNNNTSNNYYVLDRSKLRTYSGYLGLRVSF